MDNDVVLKIQKAFGAGSLKESDVQHVFALLRKLAERVPKEDWSTCALLKFYCDWTLHSKIDRSEAGAEVLARIHHVVADHLKKKDNATLLSDLSAALSLDQLRSEVNDLVRRFGGPAKLVSRQRWLKVIPILAEIIADVPLTITPKNKKLKALSGEIRLRPLKGTSVVVSLAVVTIPSSVLRKGTPANEVTYCLMLTTTDTTRIVAPLTLG